MIGFKQIEFFDHTGMGEVYRGRDTKLEREVAIKLLPDSVARDPARLARFEREAKVLAALNHPNIAQIYGIEESSGVSALVMELVPGNTLKGPLPLATALKYAAQIAAALEAAHEKGIVHRDLKPANIMVTPAGQVKVLDFGLAAQIPAHAAAASPENSPTFTMAVTHPGVILGTAAYMSPEQARGEPVDRRADIWAFGVILFEMLAGKATFQGNTVTDVLASILVREPDFSQVPPKVRPLLRRCLEKDPHKRLRDIGDAMALVEEGPSAAEAPATSARIWQSHLRWTAGGALLLIAAAAAIGRWSAPEPREPPPARLDVDLGADVDLAMPFGSIHVMPSPDGSSVLYLAAVGGPTRLYLRKLDQFKALELPGTEGANSPFFSPDGRWVGFSIADKLYKIALEGGGPVLLSAPGVSRGSAWGEDGEIITSVLMKGLVSTPSNGGNPTTIVSLPEGEDGISAPQALPGDKTLLYAYIPVMASHRGSARVEVLSLADRKRKVVVEAGSSPRYVADTKNSGYLLYTADTTMFAVAFDLDRLEKRGAPVAVLTDVGVRPLEQMQFEVSRSGALIYRKHLGGSGPTLSTIQRMDAAGRSEPLVSKPGPYRFARLSPDGKRVLVATDEGSFAAVQVYDLERETWMQLPGGARYILAIWGADGQSVLLGTLTGLYWTRADGAGQVEPLLPGKVIRVPLSISPDGRRLAYNEGIINQTQIWTVPLESAGGRLKAGTPEPFLRSAWRDLGPNFSPDGRFLAYVSNQSGVDEVYVRSVPDNGSLWKISNSGGSSSFWSGGGRELLYQTHDQVLAVNWSVKEGVFVPGKPHLWARVAGIVTDVFPDGKRLVVVAPVNASATPRAEHEVVLFQNFIGFLKQHVPTGK
jgi:serine/threonine-protein kinase